MHQTTGNIVKAAQRALDRFLGNWHVGDLEKAADELAAADSYIESLDKSLTERGGG